MEPVLGGRRVAGAAFALVFTSTVALAVVGLVDQQGGRALVSHAAEIYAPHGKSAEASLMYGVIYLVTAVDLLLWLFVLRSARAGSKWAAWFAIAVITVTGSLALALLGVREYGEQVFPTMWGVIALLSPAAGVLVLARLVRRE